MEHKALAIANAQFKLESDDATFAGYASTFGNVDSYGDTIVKGAYADTLKLNGLPKMFFNHDSNAVPIGKWVEAKEDDYGLLLRGEFTPGNALAQEVKAALKHGTVDSMSIGYALKKGDYEDTPAGRTIKRVARLAETSIVTFPADKFARVDLSSVKAFADDLAQVETIRDFEYFLRDAGNFSKGAAQALTARAKALFSLRDAGDDAEATKNEAEILARLERMTK
ncbi:HK97 family phage prohead protease [Massilia sp. CCM 8733]|uniref:HK97 family phage prohead protease n=1 Tax=Massilia mucilaginosa TaxID=2609282 RepID=A0ABX0P3B9_9BURK|nr:HK97 family phage prohead protease [Massilia mucilaginosa]NHZ93538.1 HK97 family phage prohead protease [Massilia mucilaginosa]